VLNSGNFIFQTPIYNKLTIILDFLLLTIILINIKNYGGIPILMIYQGANINIVNKIQEQAILPGIYGLQSLLIYFQIILLPEYFLYAKNKIKRNWIYIHTAILLFALVYSGKRQWVFIFITYFLSYLWIYTIINKNNKFLSKLIKWSFIILIISILFFSSLGLLRTNKPLNIEMIFKPIIDYASLPYMNLSNIINKANTNPYKYKKEALFDTLLMGAPSIIKRKTNLKSIKIIPKIEKTSSNSLYGNIFWNFDYYGVVIFMYFLGLFVGYVFLKALHNNRIFISLYSILVWPLLSIHTYNHFLNTMFVFFPCVIILLLSMFKLILKQIFIERK